MYIISKAYPLLLTPFVFTRPMLSNVITVSLSRLTENKINNVIIKILITSIKLKYAFNRHY